MSFPLDTRIWEPDSIQKIGGLCELAGVSIEEVFKTRKVLHPIVGKTVHTPFGPARIDLCITHPYGYLLFDLIFPEPVPYFIVEHWKNPPEAKVVNSIDDPTTYFRLSGTELKCLLAMGSK